MFLLSSIFIALVPAQPEHWDEERSHIRCLLSRGVHFKIAIVYFVFMICSGEHAGSDKHRPTAADLQVVGWTVVEI